MLLGEVKFIDATAESIFTNIIHKWALRMQQYLIGLTASMPQVLKVIVFYYIHAIFHYVAIACQCE